MAVLYNNNYKVEFYIRSAKRFLLTYYFVIFFTLVFSYLVRTPNQTEQVITQVKYATVSVVEYFCNSEYKYSNDNGAHHYFDGHHFTITGSSRLRSVFDNILLK